ncbi:MAG: pyridoxamine 5'-phosphate oxidase family protein [Candidatus Thorarchaeota archaeon]
MNLELNKNENSVEIVVKNKSSTVDDDTRTNSQKPLTFDDIEKHVRRRKFGIISTVDTKGLPHSTGILFGVSPPESPLAFYIVTQKTSAKVRYIKNNPNVSLVVTFPHYYLRFVPDCTVMFRGKADIISLEDEDVQSAFSQGRILKANMDVDSEVMRDTVVIRIKPFKTVYCYGIGIGMNDLRKDPTKARYKITIPKSRRLGKGSPMRRSR